MSIISTYNRKNLINQDWKKLLFIQKKPHGRMCKDNLDKNAVIFYGII